MPLINKIILAALVKKVLVHGTTSIYSIQSNIAHN